MHILEIVDKRPVKIFILVLIFFLFLIRSSLLWYSDFGWHLKLGEYILNFGFPRTDPFSYTMASFPMISFEWLPDVVFYLVYSNFGYFPLAVVFSALGFLSIYISFALVQKIKLPKGLDIYRFSIFILTSGLLINSLGVRPHVFAWLFLAILLYILYAKNTKLKYILPIFFVVWTNIHASFAAGIAALVLYTVGKTLRTKKIYWDLVAILALSLLATLVNPYLTGMWREVWMTMSDPNLAWRIGEWNPIFLTFDFSVVVFFILSILLLLRYRHKFLLEEKLIYIFFLYEAFISKRHVALAAIACIPLLIRGGLYFYSQLREGEQKTRFKIFSAVLFLIFLGSFLISAKSSLDFASLYRLDSFYPDKAVEYLKNSTFDGQLFSEYSWGGYLIWKYPQKRVFIDGRMAIWKWNANIDGESNNAMDDYKNITLGNQDQREIFNKYNITRVLWPKNLVGGKSNALLYFIYLTINGKPPRIFNFAAELEDSNWQKIYEDEVSVIYSR